MEPITFDRDRRFSLREASDAWCDASAPELTHVDISRVYAVRGAVRGIEVGRCELEHARSNGRAPDFIHPSGFISVAARAEDFARILMMSSHFRAHRFQASGEAIR
jgi:hypothetical protein